MGNANAIRIEAIPFKTHRSNSLRPTDVTVFVGPNNSGKSLALKEISEFYPQRLTRLIEKVELGNLSQDSYAHLFSRLCEGPFFDETGTENKDTAALFYKITRSLSIEQGKLSPPQRIFEEQKKFEENKKRYPNSHYYAPPYTEELHKVFKIKSLFLDLKNRLRLSDTQTTSNFGASNWLTRSLSGHLMRNPDYFKPTQEAFHNLTDKHLYLNYTKLSSVHLCYCEDEIPEGLQHSLRADALERFLKTKPLGDNFSEGIIAYTSMNLHLHAFPFDFVFIDEPEAHLHPPLARQFGNEFGALAKERKGQFFAASHSPEFLLGVIDSGAKVQIVRLGYDKEIATATIVGGNELEALMRQPTIRHTGFLNGLFHKSVVAVEASADRVFYQDINDRLKQANKEHLSDTLFLHGVNKQNALVLMGALRKMGVPTAAIIDLDLVKDAPSTYNDYLGISEEEKKTLASTHTGIEANQLATELNLRKSYKEVTSGFEKVLKSAGKNITQQNVKQADFDEVKKELEEIREKLLGLLKDPEKQTDVEAFLEKLKSFGLFLVPFGDLEGWLPEVKIGRRKDRFLTNLYNEIGSWPGDKNYKGPNELPKAKIWTFLEEIRQWLNNSERQGMDYTKE